MIKPVGADCNLRCAYCFYRRAHELYPAGTRHRMADDVLDKMTANMLQLRFPETVFAWQGGEPTLAGLDFFHQVIAAQRAHAAPGQHVGNAFQTNGVRVDAEWCRFFRAHNVLVGLSIDGPAAVHDQVRTGPNGSGSWDAAMRAAGLMRAHGVEFNVLCVVHSGNVDLGPGLCRWFLEQGFAYVQFIPCVEPGCPYNVTAEQYRRFLCDTFDFWIGEGAGRLSIRDFDALVAAQVTGGQTLCTYDRVCNHYLLIEHNGDVYPCDFFVFDEWKLGNLMDRPLETFFDTPRHKTFAYQKDKVPACRGCRWRALCHGGCQKDRRPAGSYAEPSVLCEAYKMFFAHAAPKLKKLAKRVKAQRAHMPT